MGEGPQRRGQDYECGQPADAVSSRPGRQPMDEGAQALIDTSTAAMRAAEAKNADQLFSVGGEMYSACLSCHENYMSGD
jgi:hypothetical protein